MTDARSLVPDGITSGDDGNSGRPNPLPLVMLTALMVAGIFGLFGGHADPVTRADSAAVSLSVRTPEILRNGMVFETLIEVEPRHEVGNLVIAISDRLWREITINTMIPAAEKEHSMTGFHRFDFGKVKAGERLLFKIDGQINPPLTARSEGEIIVLDGDTRLVGVPVTTKVWP